MYSKHPGPATRSSASRQIFPDPLTVDSPVRKVNRRSIHLTSNPKVKKELYTESEDNESYSLSIKSDETQDSSGSRAARSGASFEDKMNPENYFRDIYGDSFQHIEIKKTPYGDFNYFKMTGNDYIIYFFPKGQLNTFYKLVLDRLHLLKEIIIETQESVSLSESASPVSSPQPKRGTRPERGTRPDLEQISSVPLRGTGPQRVTEKLNTTKNIIQNENHFWKSIKKLNSYFHKRKIALKELNRIPDEAYIVVRNGEKSLKILEKKFQSTHGSADQKLGLGSYFKFEYQKMFPNFKVDYAFCVNNFLYKRFWTDDTIRGDNFRQYNESIDVKFFNAEEKNDNRFTYYDNLHQWLITS